MSTAPAQTPMVADVVTDEQVYALWEMHMRAAACSPRTVKERRIWLNALGRHLGKPVVLATKIDLIGYLGRDDLTPKTRQNYRSQLHTLYTLIQDEGFRLDNPAARLPRVHTARAEPHPFTMQEVQHLLDSGIYGRTRLYVLLAVYMGLRAAEIAGLHGEHVDWERQRLWIQNGKGAVRVWRPFHPLVWGEIRHLPRDQYWFPGQVAPDVPVSPKSVSNTLCGAVKRAGLAGHRAHQLRATFATEQVKAGVSTIVVSHAMRHANPATLARYVKPDDVAILDAITKIPEITLTKPSYRPRTGSALAEGGAT